MSTGFAVSGAVLGSAIGKIKIADVAVFEVRRIRRNRARPWLSVVEVVLTLPGKEPELYTLLEHDTIKVTIDMELR